jgi:hypothetical protein
VAHSPISDSAKGSPLVCATGHDLHRGGGDGRKQGLEKENQVLVAAGFESTEEEDDLWSKDGVWFGRNAALQSARQTLRTSTGRDVFGVEAS